jgi:hypothetical protein
MKKICVQFAGSMRTEEFVDLPTAEQAILETFAETGVNPVVEVWEQEQEDEGEEQLLKVEWTCKLKR